MLEADLLRAALFPFMLTGAIIIWRRGRQVIGRLLMLIGTLHLAGLWAGREPAARMAANGFVNQADSAVGNLAGIADQELVFWFALWGVWTFMLGQVVAVLERHGIALPRWFGWQLLLVNGGCAVLMLKGGFWWVMMTAGLAIWRSAHPARQV